MRLDVHRGHAAPRFELCVRPGGGPGHRQLQAGDQKQNRPGPSRMPDDASPPDTSGGCCSCNAMNYGPTGLRQVGRRRARLLGSVEVRATGVGREDRGRAIGGRGWRRQRGAGRCRETWGVQRRPGNTVLSMTVASPRPVYMGEVGAFVPWQAVIQHLVETGQRESASQNAKQQDGGSASNEPLRHRVHDTIHTPPRSSHLAAGLMDQTPGRECAAASGVTRRDGGSAAKPRRGVYTTKGRSTKLST